MFASTQEAGQDIGMTFSVVGQGHQNDDNIFKGKCVLRRRHLTRGLFLSHVRTAVASMEEVCWLRA